MKTRSLAQRNDKYFILEKFDKSKKVVRVELKPGIGSNGELFRPKNYSLSGSNHPNCEGDLNR